MTLRLPVEILPGPDKDVRRLFEDAHRRLVHITLRNGAILARHSSAVPITIQCLAGKAELGTGAELAPHELDAGVLVPLDANVLHELRAKPEVSILLTLFKDGGRERS